MRLGKAKKCPTSPYNSITFLGDQKFTTKSLLFAFTSALMTCFTKVFVFDRLFFHPLPASHLWTKAFCKEEGFLKNHHRTTLAACLEVLWREMKSWMESEECFLHYNFPTKYSDIWYDWLQYQQQGGYLHWYELPNNSPIPPQHIDNLKQINP